MNSSENDRFLKTRSAGFLLLVAAAMTLAVACTGQFAQTTQRLETLKQPAASEHQASDFQTMATAAKFCECVAYMRNVGILPTTAKGDGKDQGPNLTAIGYKAVASGLPPKIGDVAVYQKDYGNGINSTSGHIGSVTDVWTTKDKNGAVTGFRWKLRSSNYAGVQYTDAGCNNVSNHPMSTDISPSSTYAKRVTFYRK